MKKYSIPVILCCFAISFICSCGKNRYESSYTFVSRTSTTGNVASPMVDNFIYLAVGNQIRLVSSIKYSYITT
ncbi:MAG: hypothetical protein LBL16_05410 [Endomicrobium sp.]|jgi:hypothetical protein|nr:hypothetical protein [Endomicrobium sp.]